MNMTPLTARLRLCGVAVAACLCLLAGGAAAAEGRQAGTPDTSCVGSPTNCVAGSASFQVTGDGDDLRVVYQCDAVASTFATATIIRSEAEEGCVLKRGSATLDVAPGLGLPGPAAATEATTTIEPGTATLRVCWRAYATFSNGGNMTHDGCSPALPSDPQPHIEDIAGDANGLNAAGIQLDTRPASHDPMDLLAVWFETTYIAIPVGEDGIRHEPTGLAIRIRTLGPPERFHGFRTLFQIDTTIAGCRSGLGADLGRDPDTDELRVITYWDQLDPHCPDGNLLFHTDASRPGWTTTIDEGRRELRLEYPFSTLTPKQAEILRAGSTLAGPRAESRVLHFYAIVSGHDLPRTDVSNLIDASPTAPNFVIGSDVPPDIPCTKGCPS